MCFKNTHIFKNKHEKIWVGDVTSSTTDWLFLEDVTRHQLHTQPVLTENAL